LRPADDHRPVKEEVAGPALAAGVKEAHEVPGRGIDPGEMGPLCSLS
jgi:hypothetical protein